MKFYSLRLKRQLLSLVAVLIGFPATLSLFAMYMAAGEITGVVYRDFNANGTKDAVTNNTTRNIEPGVPGVTVRAFDASGAQVGLPAVTNASGAYTIAGLASNSSYRVEFTDLAEGDFSGAFGSGSGTSVQFVNTGLSGANNVNLGINYPAQYSNTRNPYVVTNAMIAGDNLATGVGQAGNSGTLVRLNHYAEGDYSGTRTDKAYLASGFQIGSVMGHAYAKKTGKLYSAAFLKRHVGLGPLGLGGVYVTDVKATNNLTKPASEFQFVTIPNAGTVDRTGENALPALASNPSRDYDAFDKVGKAGLGDIDISDDERFLYVVNLNDRRLYRVEIETKAISSVEITNPGCSGTNVNSYRPFGLKFYRGKVYVGMVCSNEATPGGTRPYANHNGVDANTAGMNASVWAYDVKNWDSFSSISNVSKVLDFPLTYRKEPTNNENFGPNTGHMNSWYWNPWSAIQRADRGQVDNRLTSYPQPWLTDIEFDVDGDMILGIRDRFGDQMGWANYGMRRANRDQGNSYLMASQNVDDYLFSGISTGEILRARRPASSLSWSLEQNGGFPGAPGSAAQTAADIHGPGGVPGVNNNKGGKYYWGEQVGEVGQYHGASSVGGLALLAGSDRVIMSAIDPNDVLNSGGIRRVVNSTGAAPANNGAYLFTTANPYRWGKANGMGDVELLTDPAPIEIGNRVWRDIDGDGIQDAGEPAIPGVTVELHNEAGTLIATAVTDANGNYIFSSDPNRTSTNAFRYSLGLVYGSNYKIRIPNVSGGSKQTALGTDRLTKANQTSGTGAFVDERDSDGVAVEGQTYSETAVFALGEAGENNHSYDFGFAPLGAIGDFVWIDANGDGVQNPEEVGANGITVTLYKKDDTGAFLPHGSAQTTRDNPANPSQKGWYWFDDLESGEYQVCFTNVQASYEGYIFTQSGAGGNTALDSDAGSDGCTGTIIINTAEPVTSILRVNPTIDAGITPVGALGDYVWVDANGNGIQDAGETGVNDVTVTLYKEEGGVFQQYGDSKETDNVDGQDGFYWFDNLPSGNYRVCFTNIPASYEGYGFTTSGAGDNTALDSDAGSDGCTGTITINTAEPITSILRVNPTIDAGITPVGALGDYVWVDANGNGIQDASETGVNDVTVTLYKEEGGVFQQYGDSKETDNVDGQDGFYWFDNLPSGNYRVCFTNIPASYEGYGFTTSGAGDNTALDSDAGSDGCTGTITINTAELLTSIQRVNPTIDAGIRPVGALGHYVWVDTNANGIQDVGETGVNDVTVTLYKEEGGVFQQYGDSKETDNVDGQDGFYWFDNLPSGNYRVCFTNIPPFYEGYGFTTSRAGDNTALDSDAGPDGCTAIITINTAESLTSIERVNPTIDAGITPVGSLGDYVWFDENTNGEQDEVGKGVDEVVVRLYKQNDEGTSYLFQRETKTNSAGWYEFANLLSGTYQVQFVAPTGHEFTRYQYNGVSSEENSDASITAGQRYGWTEDIVINTSLPLGNIGRNNPTIDAGIVPEGALPVTLASFTGAREGSVTRLNWTTTNELNSSYFEVQRSADGKVWSALGRVATTGGEGITQRYNFSDAQPVRGLNYYRLRTVDHDGTFELSQIIIVEFTGEAGTAYVYPNPVSNSIRFGGEINPEKVKSVKVSDIRGVTVYQSGVLTTSGIPVRGFTTGFHIVSLVMEDGTTRIFKVLIEPSEKK